MPQHPEWTWLSISLQDAFSETEGWFWWVLWESWAGISGQNMEQKLSCLSPLGGCGNLNTKPGTWTLLPTLTERHRQWEARILLGFLQVKYSHGFGSLWNRAPVSTSLESPECWEEQWDGAKRHRDTRESAWRPPSFSFVLSCTLVESGSFCCTTLANNTLFFL